MDRNFFPRQAITANIHPRGGFILAVCIFLTTLCEVILHINVMFGVVFLMPLYQSGSLLAECKTMGCQHLCISIAGGHGMCMCSQDFELQADNKTCKRK